MAADRLFKKEHAVMLCKARQKMLRTLIDEVPAKMRKHDQCLHVLSRGRRVRSFSKPCTPSASDRGAVDGAESPSSSTLFDAHDITHTLPLILVDKFQHGELTDEIDYVERSREVEAKIAAVEGRALLHPRRGMSPALLRTKGHYRAQTELCVTALRWCCPGRLRSTARAAGR